MHIQKDYYICDNCKDKIDGAVHVCHIPIERVVDYFPTEELHLCKDCANELGHVIKKHFHAFHIDGKKLVDEEENEDE